MNTAKAWVYFDKNDISKDLETLYESVPKGSCQACTKCCSEAVNTFYSEYLHLSKKLLAENRYKEKAIACIVYYLTELVRPMKCPMLEADGRCAVYFERPLPCRVFGHLNRTDYEANYASIKSANEEVAEVLKAELEIIVPDSLIQRKIPYCELFKSPKPMSADDQEDLVDQLFTIETKFLASGLLDTEELNYSLVQWFAYEWLGEEQATNLRILISQELSKSENSLVLDKTIETLQGAEFFENFAF